MQALMKKVCFRKRHGLCIRQWGCSKDSHNQQNSPSFVDCSCKGSKPVLTMPFPHMLEFDHVPFVEGTNGPSEGWRAVEMDVSMLVLVRSCEASLWRELCICGLCQLGSEQRRRRWHSRCLPCWRECHAEARPACDDFS